MELWIIFTFIAATAQTFRSAGQKNLKGKLNDFGASYVRFSYALPFAIIWLIFWGKITNQNIPDTNFNFWIWTTIGGLAQIAFTILLMMLFSLRNFAAGTAFSKTDILQAAIFEAIIIGEIVSLEVGIGIFIGVIAVLILSFQKSFRGFLDLSKSILSYQTFIGLSSGAFLGLSTVAFGAATDSLETGDVMMRASTTASLSILFQTIVLGLAIYTFNKNELKRTFIHWKEGMFVGFFAAVTTACWFSAFSLKNVASARAVGQIELLITLIVSSLFFKERITKTEYLSITFLVVSIILVILD